VRLLKKFTRDIVLALDADAAGRLASARGDDVINETLTGEAVVPVVQRTGLVRYQETTGVALHVAVLPQGRDPDDVIREDPAQWSALVAQAVPILDFRLDALAASHDLTNPNGRAAMVRDFLPILSVVTDPVVRAHYLQRLGRLAGTGERELSAMLPQKGEKRRERPSTTAPSGTGAEPTAGDVREEFLLALILRFPQLRDEAQSIPEDLLWTSESRAVLQAWKTLPAEADGSDQKNTLIEALPVELIPYVERLTLRRMPDYDPKEAQKALADCLARIQHRGLEMEKQATGSLLAETEAEVGVTPLAEAGTGEGIDDERLLEVAGIHVQDMRTGLKLHGKEANDRDNSVETGHNG